MRRFLIPFLLIAHESWLVCAVAVAAPSDRLKSGEHIAQIGDIKVWYRIEGQGEPVLLLHGGFGSADHWKKLAPILTPHFLLIEPDSRGQGHTTGSDAPI